MDINTERIKRQVQALEKISELPKSTLTQILLGINYDKDTVEAKNPISNKIASLTTVATKYALDMLRGANFNGLQWKAFDSVVFGTDGVSFLQGPPGTGKSHVISFIAVFCNLIGVPILAGAPSRVATKAMALKIIKQLQSLPEDARQDINLTISPTFNESQSMALEHLGQRERTAKWSSPEDILLRDYQLFVKILTGVESHWDPKDKVDQKAKRDWVRLYKGILTNDQKLTPQQWDFFWSTARSFRGIFLDKSTMIVSTVNNQGALIRTSTKFLGRIERDGLAIIDEANVDPEFDISITLSFNPYCTSFVGDHFQLSPICGSEGVNEFGSQGTMSLFQRVAEGQDPKLFTMLQMTYRFPARLADLPGAISGYVGLCTQDPSAHDTDPTWQIPLHKAIKRPGNYQQEFDKLPKGDARRLFINQRTRSGKANHSMSTVNYGNINAIYAYVDHMVAAQQTLKEKITILVPFAAQLTDMNDFFDKTPLQGIRIKTIDSYQGSEEDIILLDLTTANEHDPAAIGFLRKWNRINVAITRCKQALVMFGNLDLLRTRIEAINDNASSNFALMLMDIIDRGDVIDYCNLDAENDFLPKDAIEWATQRFTLKCPPSQMKELRGRPALPIRDKKAPETISSLEWKLIRRLDDFRVAAANGRLAAEAQSSYVTGLFDMLESKIDHDDNIEGKVKDKELDMEMDACPVVDDDNYEMGIRLIE
ncbi:uncharacterized protein LY89DRAFT_733877 [Mollisia scopiformis]|uniref:DNA2/NAM7 helicase-like C-terminal domain-containing protein n=1 Tax=Mollisia scopiformis TaxID=149040 RepID=A0A194X9N4_MOLSC|nr:uncharacterized protein LY89DRAFT_733877 [Mollisia scopiformis]KUJ16873.1 hypothetical protein LY89DRAFT_733877 [Mollisia scopiformis]